MEIANYVKRTVSSHVDIALDIDQLKDEDLLDVIGVNSINFIRIVLDLEAAYDFEFDIDMLGFESYANLGGLIRYVETEVNQSAIHRPQ